VSFTLQDFNGNPMPFGTTLAVSGITGGQLDSSTTPATVKNATFLDFGGAGSSVANAISPTSHTAIFTSCNDVGSLNFSLKVTTPKQNTTVIALP
jgi:hypothetical protein